MARGGQVRISITGDSTGLEKAAGRSEKALHRLSGAGNRLNKALNVKSLMGFAAGLTSVGSAAALVKSSVAHVESLAKATAGLQRISGMDAQTASAWVEQAKVRGIESQKLSMAFTQLAKNSAAAQAGATKQADAFRRLGISQKEIGRLNTQQLLLRMADGFKNLDSGREKAVVGARVFGRQANALVPILNRGSGALKEQLDLVRRMGAGMDQNLVRQSGRAMEAQRNLKIAMDGLKVTLGTAVIPHLTKGAESLGKFALEMRTGEGAGGDFVRTLKSIKGVLELVDDTVRLLTGDVGKLRDVFDDLGQMDGWRRHIPGAELLDDPPEPDLPPQRAPRRPKGSPPGASLAMGGWVPGDPRRDGTLALMAGDEFVATGPGQRQAVEAGLAHPALWDWLASNQAPHFAKGGWVRTGFTIDPGSHPKQQYAGGMSFAELLQAGANRGLHPTLTELLGLPKANPYGMSYPQFGQAAQAILIRRPGGGQAYRIVKSDVGSGQPGDPSYTIDLHGKIANLLGLGGKGFVEVARVGTAPTTGATTQSGQTVTTKTTLSSRPRLADLLSPGVPDAFEQGFEAGKSGEALFRDHRGRLTPFVQDVLTSGLPAAFTTSTRTLPSPGGSVAGGVTGGRWQQWNRKGTGPNPRLVAFGRFLQSKGISVSEHPAFGGVKYPRHGHYGAPDHWHGGALDIGPPSRGNEIVRYANQWINAGMLSKWGPGVLWQVKDHYDHVHVSGHRRGGWIGRIPRFGSGGRTTGGGTLAPSASAPVGGGGLAGLLRQIALLSALPATATATTVSPILELMTTYLEDPGLTSQQLTGVERGIERTLRSYTLPGSIGGTAIFGVERPRAGALQDALSLIERAVGAKLSTSIGTADTTIADIQRGQTNLGYELTIAGIDPASKAGVQRQREFQQQAVERLTGRRDELQARLAEAQRIGNPTAIADLTTSLNTVNDTILQLRAGMVETTDALDSTAAELAAERQAIQQLKEEIKDLREQQVRVSRQIKKVQNTEVRVLKRAIADAVSGELGGRIGLGFQTPSSAGGVARY